MPFQQLLGVLITITCANHDGVAERQLLGSYRASLTGHKNYDPNYGVNTAKCSVRIFSNAIVVARSMADEGDIEIVKYDIEQCTSIDKTKYVLTLNEDIGTQGKKRFPRRALIIAEAQNDSPLYRARSLLLTHDTVHDIVQRDRLDSYVEFKLK